MTLILGGYPASGGGGGGGSTTTEFTYPYMEVWLYKKEVLDTEFETLDTLLKQCFVCNLGQATNFNVVGEGDRLTCTFNGKTIELYEDTEEGSPTEKKTIGKYDNEDIVAILVINLVYAGGLEDSLLYFNEFKQYFLGIEPEPELGPA